MPASLVRADTFILKDNREVVGVAAEEGDVLVITTRDGRVLRVLKADVVGRQAHSAVMNAYLAKTARLRLDDAAGHYALGLAARKDKLEDEARYEFNLALEADPFHEGAGKALGYVQDGAGRWIAQAEPSPAAEGQATAQPKPDAATLRKEAQELAKRLAKLELSPGSAFEDNAEAKALVALAAEKPDLFVRVMRAPGLPDSGEVKDGAVRTRAAEILGRAGDRRAMQGLLESCFTDPDVRVREAAAKALPKLEEPVALRKLVDVAISPSRPWATTRRLACIAIMRYGDKEAVERLLAAVSFELAGGNAKDPKNPLRKPAAGLGTDDPMGLSVDEPSHLGKRDETELYPALTALKYVTGTNFDSGEYDYKTWKIWWQGAKEKFEFKP
ncbi:MAG: HEAT repeat domain-containing protein [Planctomycetes bacterium]|nr:HEAT repeat domain-containing protein [Planctomycetota bacterium]